MQFAAFRSNLLFDIRISTPSAALKCAGGPFPNALCWDSNVCYPTLVPIPAMADLFARYVCERSRLSRIANEALFSALNALDDHM